MSKLIDLNPPKELVFKVIDPKTAKCELKIQNLVSDNIAYKIRTTAPSFYSVKPNTGIISGSSSTISSIILTIPPSVKDHKFMIVAARTSLSENEFNPDVLNEFWAKVKTMGADEKEERKMKVALQSDNFQKDEPEEIIKPKSQTVYGKAAPQMEIDPMEEKKKRGTEIETKIIEVVDSGNQDEINTWNDKIKSLENKYKVLVGEVESKENELKDLNDKEAQDDNKTVKRPKQGEEQNEPLSGNNKRLIGISNRKQMENQFHLIHLLIAIIGGFVLGMILSKIF